MITKLTRLLIVTFIVGICIAVVYLNPQEITLSYGLHKQVTAMGGIIYLVLFGLGVLFSLYLWVVYGVKVFLRERSFKTQQEKQKQFYESFLLARALQTSGEFSRASDLWQKLIKKDPTDIIARVELSRTLEQSGDYKAALKVLDKAREVDATNGEVLLQAAHLNERLGNKTAALDNLALALYQEPTAFAAGKARDISLELGRIEDATEYQSQYEMVGGDPLDLPSLQVKFLVLKEEVIRKSGEDKKSQDDALLKALQKFTKRCPHYLPAILELVDLEEQQGHTAEAAEVLLKAAKENHAPALWKRAIELWLEKDDGERALSAARTAIRNASNKHDRQVAQLDLARVHLLTGKPEQALSELEELAELENSEDMKLQQEFFALSGYSLNQLERHRDAAKVWKRLLEIRGSDSALHLLTDGASSNGVVYYPALGKEMNS